jgi:uncharacterized protein involved in exopolysaccharide biosynthesis
MKSYPDANPDQEVELTDIVKVLWKWKYFILIGTLVCIVITVIIGSYRPKIYRGQTVVQPEKIYTARGEIIEIDTPHNIKMIISQVIIKDKLHESITQLAKDLEQPVKFNVRIPRNTSFIEITCESSDKKAGLTILGLLIEALNAFYADSLKYFFAENEITLQVLKSRLLTLNSQKRSTLNRIKELQDLRLTFNTENNHKEKNLVIDILEIIEDYETKLVEIDQKKATTIEEIKSTESFKNNFKPIKTIKESRFRKTPIKPNLFTNVVVSGVAGFLFITFIAFFLDYLSIRSKLRKNHSPFKQREIE